MKHGLGNATAADPSTLLAAGLNALAIPVDPRMEQRVRLFLSEVRRWNRVGRLTGYRSEAEQIQHLVIESLLLLRVLPTPPTPLLDIGTGSGVPGLILKVARPEWEVVLMDANRRRANFLRHVVRSLGLEGVVVHQGRAEVLAGSAVLRARFRTVTMRAVAAPDAAVRLARPFLRTDGHVVVPLGPGGYEGPGVVREVSVSAESSALRLRRAFLIIEAPEVEANVPRGTPRARGAHLGGRQPKGRRG